MEQDIKSETGEEPKVEASEAATQQEASESPASEAPPVPSEEPQPEEAVASEAAASAEKVSEEEIPTEQNEINVQPEAKSQAVLEPQLVSSTVEAAPAPVMGESTADEVSASAEESSEAQEEEDEDDGALPKLSPEQENLPWYVVHTYSGYEMRVKLGIEERIRAEGVEAKFGHVVVPEEKVVELVRGEKKTSKKKVFPGYILVQCLLDDETWHLVKATPKVTGFIGDSQKPVPLAKEEVESLMAQMAGDAQRARPSVQYEQGDSIKVVDGPFADFNGTVDEVKPDKGKLRVLISIFGRNTPVELDFVQVEKV